MESDYAAILLDINMPGMDGFETAALIHQHPRFEKTPIIFVTAVHVTDLDRLKGYELGAVDYVYVPVVPEILRGKVQVLIELYRQRRELERLNQQLAADELANANAALQAEKARELEALNADARAGERRARGRRTRRCRPRSLERERAQEALEAADRRKDDFLAMLSHELRNPLAAIQGVDRAHAEEGDRRSAARRGRATSLARQNRHLTRLIDDLLDVSRITSGKLTLQKEPVELARRRAARRRDRAAADRRAAARRSTIAPARTRPLHVEGDAVRLSQVIGNLLTNAAKYTDEGGAHRSFRSSAMRGGAGIRRQALIRVRGQRPRHREGRACRACSSLRPTKSA